MYRVILLPLAHRAYTRAEQALARKLARCFLQLEHDPRRHPNIKALKGILAGHWRFRVGDYRVVYRIEDANRIVWVDHIAHRREAYG
jgi:mRNA interferase RelE/StbE